MATEKQLLEHHDQQAHLLQFYGGDERPLLDNVSRYLLQGLESGDGLAIIAGKNRNESIVARLNQLGADIEAAEGNQQIVFADARPMLDKFMVEGQPDWALFLSSVGALVNDTKLRAPSGRLRAYGEMVGVLWEAGQYSAAIRLEHYWNELRDITPCELFCAYPINIMDTGFRAPAVNALLCAHTHLLPGGANEHLQQAINRAMDEVLGTNVDSVRALMHTNYGPRWPQMPPAEGSIFWLRSNLPEHADQIIDRARDYYPV